MEGNLNTPKRSDFTKSLKWFFESIKNLGSKSKKDTIKSGRLSPFFIGRMLMFTYDPKLKNKLPYYDANPLIFPIELYDDGFLGINLHYLPPLLRTKLLYALLSTINKDKIDEKTKLNISYNILNSASKFKYFKPCVKRYLYNHVRSNYYLIPVDEWNKSVLLPTQNFVGSTERKIYNDSISKA